MFKKQPYLELNVAGMRQKRYQISSDRFTIGSALSCDVQVSHPDIASEQVVITRSGADYVVESVGHSVVQINGSAVSVQKLTTGDVLSISNVVVFTYVNPAELALKNDEDRRLSIEKKRALSGQVTLTSRLKLPVLLFGSMMTVLVIFGYAIGSDEKTTLLVNNEQNAVAAVDGVGLPNNMLAESLANCIISASRRGNVDAWARVTQSMFWQYAARFNTVTSIDVLTNDPGFQELRTDVLHHLWTARQHEAARRFSAALEAYGLVKQLVPDVGCAAHVLAASRVENLTKQVVEQ